MSAKRTVVDAEPLARATSSPSRNSATACPVSRSPEPPAMCFQRSRATSTVPGLPTTSGPSPKSISSIESQATTTLSGNSAATAPRTASALASASATTRSVGEASPRAAVTASSSTPETRTIGSIPAAPSTARRAGEAEASTNRTSREGTGLPVEVLLQHVLGDPVDELDLIRVLRLVRRHSTWVVEPSVDQQHALGVERTAKRDRQVPVRVVGAAGDGRPPGGGDLFPAVL